MINPSNTVIYGELLEEDVELNLEELSQACGLTVELVIEMTEYGIVDPIGNTRDVWRFRGISVRRVRQAEQLRRDLGVNMAGAALALDLLEELRQVRAQLSRLES